MFTVSSFNIRCFGYDGQYDGKKGTEGRIKYLKEFISKELNDSNVLILQEIMDIDILSKILPKNYNFQTYTHDYQRHMNVVLCYESIYELSDFTKIDYTALDDKRSRPAIYGKLTHKSNKKEIAHIIGVHLKSGIHHTDRRLKQTHAICNFINELSRNIPVIIGGDFNSHSKTATHKKENDVTLMEEAFLSADLKRVKNSDFTYYTQWERECLDHIWVSKGSISEEKLWTYNIEKHSQDCDALYSIKTYYAEISDHLPIKIRIDK